LSDKLNCDRLKFRQSGKYFKVWRILTIHVLAEKTLSIAIAAQEAKEREDQAQT